MSTLESQYKEFIKLNPRADLSFEEWEKINARLVKQALVNMMKADEDLGLYDETTKCYCGHTTTCDCGPEEPKQNWYHDGKIIDGKQEQMYSEEEVLDILRKSHSIEQTSKMDSWITKWFEQFKKK